MKREFDPMDLWDAHRAPREFTSAKYLFYAGLVALLIVMTPVAILAWKIWRAGALQ